MDSADDAVVRRVDAVLDSFLDACAESLRTVGPELDPVAVAARRIALHGGKRLRPRFAYWGWRCVRDAAEEDTDLIDAAAAVELLHACALVHDDLMDASDTRRGQPAVHAAFAALHREQGWHGDAQAFGGAAAVLVGDLLLCWADALFARAAVGAAARAVYDSMRETVMAGQYLDVLVQARGRYSAEDALRVAQFKTGKYTVEGPLHLGAAAADAPDDVFGALSAYARAVGEAFQLRDDVLGVWGDPTETGKPAGDDLREGKQTLLVALAMERATDEQAALLRRSLGVRTLDAAQVHALREVIVVTGALDDVERRIAQRTAEARTGLRTAPINA
ncbi:MAG TPA: polyprenyl synthetase family protein, partial [Jatrophihabitantaceae bacterium]